MAAADAFLADYDLSIDAAAINHNTGAKTLRRHLLKHGLPHTVKLKKESFLEKPTAMAS